MTEPPEGPERSTRSRLNAALKRAFGVLREHGREDVVDRALQLVRARPSLPRVVIVGETKRGKSTLTNALVGYPDLSPVGANETSATFVTVIPDADSAPHAMVLTESGEPQRIGLDELRAHTDLSRLSQRGAQPPLAVDVRIPPGPIGEVIVVDTPGVGGLTTARGKLNQRLAADGGMLIYVLDAGSPMARPELEYLLECAEQVEEIAVVVTMIDKYPHSAGELIGDLRRRLAQGSPRLARVPVFGVQAPAALAAARAPGAAREQLWQVSGLPPLIARVQQVSENQSLLAVRTAIRVALTGLRQVSDRYRLQWQAGTGSVSAETLNESEVALRAEIDAFDDLRNRWSLDFERDMGRIVQECSDVVSTTLRDLDQRIRADLEKLPILDRDRYVRAINLDLLTELQLLDGRLDDLLTERFTALLAAMFGDGEEAPVIAARMRTREAGALQRSRGGSGFDPSNISMGLMGLSGVKAVAGIVGSQALSVAIGGALAGAGALLVVVPWLAYTMAFKSKQTERGQLSQELSRLLSDYRSRLMADLNAWPRETKPEVVIAYREHLKQRELELREAQKAARAAKESSEAERKQFLQSMSDRVKPVLETIAGLEKVLAETSGTLSRRASSDG